MINQVGVFDIAKMATYQEDPFWMCFTVLRGRMAGRPSEILKYRMFDDDELDHAWKGFLTKHNMGAYLYWKLKLKTS